MQKEDLTEILREHPFLHELSEEHMQELLGCASLVRFEEGSLLIREGDIANKFFLIRTGRVAVEVDVSGRGGLRVQTAGPGEVLGWSWLISPYRWHFSGIAVADTRAVALDGECLRKKCEEDKPFGYEMLKRLSQVMERRLEATRLQVIDMVTSSSGGGRS